MKMKTAFLVYKAYSPFHSVETEINSYSVLVDSPLKGSLKCLSNSSKNNKAIPFCAGLSPTLKTLKVQNGGWGESI